MSYGNIQIDQLNILVGDLSRQHGRRLGEMVAWQLAEMKVGGPSRQVSSLFVAVNSDTGSIEQLAKKIALEIQRCLK